MRQVRITALVLLSSLFSLPNFARAEKEQIDFWSEYGKRSTADLIKEEDLDLNYRYSKTNFCFSRKPIKHFGCKLGYRIYDKDYEIDESRDSQLQSFLSSWDWNCFKEPINLNWRFKADYKQRRYEHKPKNEYDQVISSLKLTLEDKDSWQLSFKGALKDYDYLESKEKDELNRYFQTAGKKYFLDKFLTIRGNYKLCHRQRIAQPNREERIVKGGFDLHPEIDFIKLLRFNIENGSGSTLDIDERDDSYDYNYRRWYILNRFKLTENINSSFRYEDLKKDYLTFNHDYTGFLLENNWRFNLIKDKTKRVSLNLGLSRKEMDYPDVLSLSFHRNRGGVRLSWRGKENWRLNCGVDLSRYNFLNKKDKNKDIYAGIVELEKGFLNEALNLSLRLRHVFKDYARRSDVEQDSYRLSLKYRF